MIYLFCGDDTKNKYLNYEKFIKSLPVDIETFFIGKNDFSQPQIESFYSGLGLFFTKCVVVLTNVFEKEENLDFVLEKLSLMNDSNNIFVFLEGKLNKTIIDAFKKARAEINVFESSKGKEEKFNNFLLANALGEKDKLNLWIYYRQAIEDGASAEELVGILFWKAKDMILKKSFNKFSEEELKKIVTKLSSFLPEARREGKDVEMELEHFILEAF